jgi:DNA-binding winged helix-turn-helix (wHTH) protein
LVTSSANEIDGVRVDSKVMEVLVALAAAAPEVVPAQALLESLWPNVVVVDYPVVNRAIAQLRNVLGDDAQAPRYIETVPRRGYRLIAPVEPVEPVELTVESDGVSASESFVLPSPGPGPVSAVARGAARLRDWWFSTIWSNPSNEFPLRRSSRIPIGLPKRSWS